jgi:hypothetical protein
VKITGTPQQRAQQRATSRAQRRTTFHASRIRAAHTGAQRVDAATAYAKAASRRLGDVEQTELARAIVALTDQARTQ